MGTALIKDMNKDYLEAINHYENEIGINELPSVDSFTNLAFLYWAFASQQIEFNLPNNISDEWSIIGGNNFSRVLEKGLAKYPRNVELHFWKHYFPYRLFMVEFTEDDCKKILKEYGDEESLVPYFFLNLFDKNKYKKKVDELLHKCIDSPTAKNIYIESFIDE